VNYYKQPEVGDLWSLTFPVGENGSYVPDTDAGNTFNRRIKTVDFCDNYKSFVILKMKR